MVISGASMARERQRLSLMLLLTPKLMLGSSTAAALEAMGIATSEAMDATSVVTGTAMMGSVTATATASLAGATDLTRFCDGEDDELRRTTKMNFLLGPVNNPAS